MEIITLDKDITVICINADSYPEGIMAAHRQLHSTIPFSTRRRYFGISRPENGGDIVYRSAAEELEPGEAAKFNLETLVLRKGNYVSITLNNYMDDLTSIGRTFNELLAYPGIDPEGYCVEWYTSNKDMQCLVRLAD